MTFAIFASFFTTFYCIDIRELRKKSMKYINITAKHLILTFFVKIINR